MKRVVLDSNVLLSALVGHSDRAPAILLDAAFEHVIDIVVCPGLIAEVRDGLAKPYFRALISPTDSQAAVAAIENIAILFADPIDPEPLLRDRADDYLVALARSAEADAIVTGDRDVLDHDAGLQPPAITAREAAQRLASPPE